MKQYIIALLLGSSSAIRISGAPAAAKDARYVPHKYAGLKDFDLTKLEHCPDLNERMTLINGKTKAVAYPAAGFNCNADYGLVQGAPAAGAEARFVPHAHAGLKDFDLTKLEHCPDMNERFTLINGKTKAVAYPAAGFNCNADYGLVQGAPAAGADARYVPHAHAGLKDFDLTKLEHCPDMNERFTLINGKTKAVAYPAAGFNCNADYGLVQGAPAAAADARYVPHKYAGLKDFDLTKLEHCPDFNERMTLINGKTKAVAYPAAGFNCNANYGLVQGAPAAEARFVPHKYAGLKDFDLTKLEHCPDFNERMTLINGKTKAVAYPAAGFNCNADYGLSQGAPAAAADTRYVPYKYSGLKGFDLTKLEHCPDFNERFTLLNGRDKAVAYPQPGYNCNADYGMVQVANGEPLYVPHVYKDTTKIAKLEHCPNFNERMTLLDGKTAAVSYPNTGFNCNAHQ